MSESYHLEDDVNQSAYDHQIMRRLFTYISPYRGWLAFATFLLLIVALLSNVTPLLIMWAVDLYINNPDRASADLGQAALNTLQTEDVAKLLNISLLISGLVLLESIIRYFQTLIVSIVGQRTMLEMRVGLFEHLQRMSLRFLDRNPVGRLMTRVTNDIEKIQQTIVTGSIQVISDLMTIVVVLIFMLVINWQLALVALSPVPFVFFTSMMFRKFAHHSFLEIRKKIARLNSFMQENISGMRIVQLFGREAHNSREYSALNADHRDEWMHQVRNFAVYFPLVEFYGTLSMSLIILYCGVQILHLGESITGVASIGTFFGYVFLAERFFAPIRALADRYNQLLEAMASSERVFELLDTPSEIVDPPDAVTPTTLDGSVAFKNVSFAYDDKDWVLKDVSFEVARGEKVAIVGHTGAGKSTIISLLNRFYDVQQGSVEVDGVDVRQYAQQALRSKIGMVLQDVFLFAGTIEENISLFDSNMDPKWIRECAEYVNAAKFINKFPDGYQHHVGERGGNLSTGQRQLLAFARTLAHKPDVLVLDEATANIDTETEELIQDAIAKLMEGRTSIVVAHRLSTVRHANRIILLHHGEIREAGTHEELLAQNGLYRTLYELQYKDQDIKSWQPHE